MPIIRLVSTTAGELRRVVGAEPRAPHARKQQQFGDLTVTLSRSVNSWALTLHAKQPIQQEMVDLWVRAMGIHSANWWRADEGRLWRADWQEDRADSSM
jgi:hypothetical protein